MKKRKSVKSKFAYDSGLVTMVRVIEPVNGLLRMVVDYRTTGLWNS